MFNIPLGQKLVDIVKAGVAEWYEVARQEDLIQIWPSVKSGEIADWDAQRLKRHDVDTEWIEEEWNKQRTNKSGGE